MNRYDLVIIGSGASGLMAAVTALKAGVKDVLLLEKEENLGGNLNLFINDGFGEFYLGESVTGPEFASILIEQFTELGGKYLVDTKVMKLSEENILTYINPLEGMVDINYKAIVFATGCKERYTGNIMIPVDKYTGIFSTAAAHRLINFQGYLPGKKVVILSNGLWSAIVARRLLVEGAEVTLVTEKEALSQEEWNIVGEFDIPVIYNSTIFEIDGDERVENITIKKTIDNEVNIECDSLVLPIGYFPEINLLRGLNIKLDRRVLNENGIFPCGTVLSGIDGIFISAQDGFVTGNMVSKYLMEI